MVQTRIKDKGVRSHVVSTSNIVPVTPPLIEFIL